MVTGFQSFSTSWGLTPGPEAAVAQAESQTLSGSDGELAWYGECLRWAYGLPLLTRGRGPVSSLEDAGDSVGQSRDKACLPFPYHCAEPESQGPYLCGRWSRYTLQASLMSQAWASLRAHLPGGGRGFGGGPAGSAWVAPAHPPHPSSCLDQPSCTPRPPRCSCYSGHHHPKKGPPQPGVTTSRRERASRSRGCGQ